MQNYNDIMYLYSSHGRQRLAPFDTKIVQLVCQIVGSGNNVVSTKASPIYAIQVNTLLTS